jgi:hypothetical protein
MSFCIYDPGGQVGAFMSTQEFLGKESSFASKFVQPKQSLLVPFPAHSPEPQDESQVVQTY